MEEIVDKGLCNSILLRNMCGTGEYRRTYIGDRFYGKRGTSVGQIFSEDISEKDRRSS